MHYFPLGYRQYFVLDLCDLHRPTTARAAARLRHYRLVILRSHTTIFTNTNFSIIAEWRHPRAWACAGHDIRLACSQMERTTEKCSAPARRCRLPMVVSKDRSRAPGSGWQLTSIRAC